MQMYPFTNHQYITGLLIATVSQSISKTNAMKTLLILSIVTAGVVCQGGEEGGYEIGWGGSNFNTPVDIKKEEVIRLKARPEYRYDYRVRDEHTKDIKDKYEVRDGYKVKGRYSLLEPDLKSVRVVDYVSDKKRGFIAKVSRRPRDY